MKKETVNMDIIEVLVKVGGHLKLAAQLEPQTSQNILR